MSPTWVFSWRYLYSFAWLQYAGGKFHAASVDALVVRVQFSLICSAFVGVLSSGWNRCWTLITVDAKRVWGFLRPCILEFTHETNTAEASSVFDTKAVFTWNHKTVKSLSILAAKWYHDTVSIKKNQREKNIKNQEKIKSKRTGSICTYISQLNSSHFLFLADSFRGLFLPVDSAASIFLTRVSSVALSCSSTVSLTFLISSVRKVCIMALSSLRASDSSAWSGRRRKMVRKCSITDTDSWNTVLRDRLFLCVFLGWVGVVSKLVFYAQSTGTVISGWGGGGIRFFLNKIWNKYDCLHSKTRAKHTKGSKERHLLGTQHAHFRGNPLLLFRCHFVAW